jgi:Fur family transcriptional regulator, peroxide stress response regulator
MLSPLFSLSLGARTTLADADQRLDKMITVLRDTGHRITPQRLAVLRILASSKNHPSVEMIYEQVKKDFPTTSLATVYKTITVLKELKEVLELGFADTGSRYDGNRPYPHPHMICTKCGAIVDPEFSGMDQMAAEMAEKSGFLITHQRLDFFGLCRECREE